MKVKCISKPSGFYKIPPLTIGKIYDSIGVTNIPFSSSRYSDYTGPMYKLKNDLGEISFFGDDCIRPLTLDEIRDLKLEELLK